MQIAAMKRLLAAAALALPLAAPLASTAEDLDPLLQILVRKGVLTEAEARQVQAEAAAQRQEETSRISDAIRKDVISAPELKPAVPIKFEMGKGVTFGTPGQLSMNIGGFIQVRFDAADSEAGGSFFTTARAKDEDTFVVRRARAKFQGNLSRKFEYETELDFLESTPLKDARIGIDPFDKQFRVNIGQYKVPFLREELISDRAKQFVESSIVAAFAPARDIGVDFDGRVAKNRFYYAVGAFNGAGEDKLNDNNGLLCAARIQFDPLGEYKLSMSDFERSKTAKVSVGLDFATSNDATDSFPRTIVGEKDMWGIDFAWKYRGWSAEAEYVRAGYNPADATKDSFDMTAWRAQIGCMVWENLEVAARWAEVSGDENSYWVDRTSAKNRLDAITQATLGLSWYFGGHANKITADYNWTSEEYADPGVEDLDDDVFRIQYQVIFSLPPG